VQGVLGCIVVNKDGVILKTTCEVKLVAVEMLSGLICVSIWGSRTLLQVQPEIAELHSHLIPHLAVLARNMVRDLDPQVG